MAFKTRIATILKNFDIFDYHECPAGANPALSDDTRPWIELNIRHKNKEYPLACCFITPGELSKLAKLLGTKDVRFTSYDLSADNDGSDYVGYIVAYGVKFK
jgi:hypothetical protein